jgi:hypothetical protein
MVPSIRYLSSPSKELLLEVSKHEAAKKTYSHAIRFKNTKKPIQSFWQEILQRLLSDPGLIERVKPAIEFVYNEQDTFASLLKDLQNYFPDGTDINCNLYTMLGYDIGIVSDGQALINLAHKEFQRDPLEILYMAMHELHHVVYTKYNQIFDLTRVHQTEQLADAVRYCTHMEGLAVYATLEQRKATDTLGPEDYQTFLDKKQRNKRVSEYFNLLTRLDMKMGYSVSEKELQILDQMSGRKRLWYIAGAHMAETIDKQSGREVLNETIRLGHDNFFQMYHEVI